MCMYACAYAHVSAVAHTGQKRASDFFLGLELEAGVSLLHWVARNQAQVLFGFFVCLFFFFLNSVFFLKIYLSLYCNYNHIII